jgi:hypothetical protein
MRTQISSVLVAAVFPFLAFVIVAAAIDTVSGRKAALAERHLAPFTRRFAYDVSDVRRYWDALGPRGIVAERRFLQYDLAFPLVYGGALAASLVWLSGRAGWSAGIALAPVIVGMIGDWTENLFQLAQLRVYETDGIGRVSAGAIRIASLATATKLVFVGAGFAFVLVLTVLVLRDAVRT